MPRFRRSCRTIQSQDEPFFQDHHITLSFFNFFWSNPPCYIEFPSKFEIQTPFYPNKQNRGPRECANCTWNAFQCDPLAKCMKCMSWSREDLGCFFFLNVLVFRGFPNASLHHCCRSFIPPAFSSPLSRSVWVVPPPSALAPKVWRNVAVTRAPWKSTRRAWGPGGGQTRCAENWGKQDKMKGK